MTIQQEAFHIDMFQNTFSLPQWPTGALVSPSELEGRWGMMREMECKRKTCFCFFNVCIHVQTIHFSAYLNFSLIAAVSNKVGSFSEILLIALLFLNNVKFSR